MLRAPVNGTLAGKEIMRFLRQGLVFALGELTIIAVAMAIEVYVRGYSYRDTPPFWNFIFGVVICLPYVVCGGLGFAFGLHLSGVVARLSHSFLVGGGLVVAVGFLQWAINQFVRFGPFDDMVAYGALVFVGAIPLAFLLRVLTRPRNEMPAS